MLTSISLLACSIDDIKDYTVVAASAHAYMHNGMSENPLQTSNLMTNSFVKKVWLHQGAVILSLSFSEVPPPPYFFSVFLGSKTAWMLGRTPP